MLGTRAQRRRQKVADEAAEAVAAHTRLGNVVETQTSLPF